jgi:hypothetical protein
VEINEDRKRPHLTEYGVAFGKVRSPHRLTGSLVGDETTTWFKLHELVAVRGAASQRPQGSATATPRSEYTPEPLNPQETAA